MSLHRNAPCEDGRRLGAAIARFADAAQPAYSAEFAAEGKPVPQRCSTCAFRLGTYPNGCLPTVADALKCAMEGVDFRCHEKDAMTPEGPQVCVGWAMLVSEGLRGGKEFVEMPWKFNGEYTAEEEAAAQ